MLVCRRSPQAALTAFAGIAQRMAWTLNRDKPRVTRVPEGLDFLGLHFVQRRRPRSGTQAIARVPAKTAPQTMRHRLQSVPSRRAPSSPQECGERGPPRGTGWAHSVRHPNASQACRGLQRFVQSRFRRYVTQRRTGRGCGWQRFPNRTLEARGLASIGRGLLEDMTQPAQGGRCRRSDRRPRANCTYGGMGWGWCPA